MSDDLVKQARDHAAGPYAEARRVLDAQTDVTWYEMREALSNLLSHVERLTAPMTGDRAQRRAYLNAAIEAALPISPEDAVELRKVLALLEADARREAALADAIRE
jgi:hypothetical protein